MFILEFILEIILAIFVEFLWAKVLSFIFHFTGKGFQIFLNKFRKKEVDVSKKDYSISGFFICVSLILSVILLIYC